MSTPIFLPIINNGMGLVRANYAALLMDAMNGRRIHWTSIGYPYPDGAMNMATAEFLKSPCERMLIIDGDMVFKRRDVDLLLSHEIPICGAVYTKKALGMHLCLSTVEERPFADDAWKEGVAPLVEVEWVGRGFLSIHRSVFEAMWDAPEYQAEGKTQKAYWKLMPGGHSEDRFLCEKWRSLGGKVFVDQRITLGHEGTACFPIPGTY